MLPKIGLEIKYIFEYQETNNFNYYRFQGIESEIMQKVEDFKNKDISALCNYSGKELLNKFQDRFDRNQVCVVSRLDDGRLGSVCWIENVPGSSIRGDKAERLITDCFTLPHMRGQGLYPATIIRSCNYIFDILKQDTVTIFINSNIFNKASIKGICKSGFKKAGIHLRLWQWKKSYIYKKESSYI